jgi:N4-gp56 family major capsid protein
MADVLTESSALSAAITFKVQKKVLENLRAELVYANQEWAEQGDFDPGTDTLLFTSFDDLSFTSQQTPLTEGAAPFRRALTMGTVTVDTDQYGDLLAITDVAKTKSPVQIISIGSERLTRSSLGLIDVINRDVIAAGGTAYYAGSGNAARADLAATDIAAVADLRRMAWQMFKSNIPRKADGFYHLLASPEVCADIAADADFIDAVKYTDRMPLLKNEIGQIAGFRVMSVVNAPTFSSTATVHASIALGAPKGWGSGELQSFQTYHVAPGGDHLDPLAQEELLGYKVMFGVAVLDNSFYFRFESAASDLTP